MKKLTNKEFRDVLNAAFPFDPNNNPGKGARAQYKARKRPYGDYLFAADREMFEADKREYEAGRLPHLDQPQS